MKHISSRTLFSAAGSVAVMMLATACNPAEIPELTATESEELADAGARIFQTKPYEIRVVPFGRSTALETQNPEA